MQPKGKQFSSDEIKERAAFQSRMAKRKLRHGGRWRQVFIDCGGMCLMCYNVSSLEFHEPFGEDKLGWGVFQSRVVLCHDCHAGEPNTPDSYTVGQPSQLAEDVAIEMIICGGYDNWVKKFGLQDTFGRLLL